jgi:hypothetical protein
VYKIPREPTAGRVYAWRKLKALGAVSLQDAVWVLPATSRTQEQFQWLAAEITELGGDITLWEAERLDGREGEGLVRKFSDPVDAAYRRILTALKRKARNLAELSKRYQEARSRDYFQSALGQQVRDRLLAVQGGRKS